MKSNIYTIVILEDEPAHMDAMRRSFDNADNKFNIICFSTLNEYYENIKNVNPDLVIADLFLPDGKAFKLLPNSSPEKQQYPIIITTAYGDEHLAIEALKRGAYDYIVKSEQIFENLNYIAEKALKEWRIIQKQKEADEAIKRSYEILDCIDKNSLILILLIDKDFKIKRANNYTSEYTGKPTNELVGDYFGIALRCLNALHNPKGCGYGEACKKCVIRLAVFDTFNTGSCYQKKEAVIPIKAKKNAEKAFFYLATSKIKPGKEPVVLVNLLDITEKKRAELALRKSEKKFRALFESIAEGAALLDVVRDDNNNIVDYLITDVNPAFEKYFNLNSKKIYKKFISKITAYKNITQLVFDKFTKVAENGKPEKFETCNDALKKHFNVSVVSPEKNKIAVLFEDITNRKLKEEELHRKSDEMNRFISTASHNLRSPVITIKTFAGYLEQDFESDNISAKLKHLHYIKNSADKIEYLVEEALTLSKIGQISEEPQHISLKDIAKKAIELVAGRISQCKAKIIITNKPVMLKGKVKLITELYQNLVDNAVKFMGEQKKPVVKIGAEQKDDNIWLYVKDNGMGIDAEQQSKIFAPFDKLDRSSEGSGMGLSIIKRIVELHNGTIEVESEGKGKGTIFCFTLENTSII